MFDWIDRFAVALRQFRDEAIPYAFSRNGRVRWQIKLAGFLAPIVLAAFNIEYPIDLTDPTYQVTLAGVFVFALAFMCLTVMIAHVWLHDANRRPAHRVVPDGQVTYLYRWYGVYQRSADRLLYVGITNHMLRRTSQHEEEKPWFPAVRRSTVELHYSREAAETAERLAIRTERPVYNVAHNGEKPAATTKNRRVASRPFTD